MATVDLSNGPYHLRVYKSGFFRFPREIRDLIYEYLLVQPDYLSRRHRPFCDLSDRGSVEPETPPFMIDCPSRCSRRQGLSLLLANRQVHEEAAPIFWSRNMHFFRTPATFHTNVSELREKYRDCLRHVQIGFRIGWGRGYLEGRDAMWKGIFLCKNLRTLELEPEFVEYNSNRYRKVLTNLPHLESITFAEVRRYECGTRNTADFDDPTYYIYLKITKKIPLRHKTRESHHEIMRNFATNHVVHVDWEVNKRFLKEPAPGSELPRVLSPHLKDNNSVQTVTLRDGTVIDLPFYGLPNSPATRAKHFRQRLFEQNRRKAAGLPRVEEEEIARRMKEVKMEKKEKMKVEEECAREHEQKEKKLEQEKFREEQTLAETKNRRNQRTHRRRKARKAEKIKQEERKRVPKIS